MSAFREILAAPAPPSPWWRKVSAAALSGRPYWEVLIDLYSDELGSAVAAELYPGEQELTGGPDPDLPGDLYTSDEHLEELSQDEALALMARFLQLDRGDYAAGVEIHLLHWLVLAALYTPRRPRYRALRELVNEALLVPAEGARRDADSGMRWPLVITDRAVRRIERLVYLERFMPRRFRVFRWIPTWLREIPLIGDLAKRALPPM